MAKKKKRSVAQHVAEVRQKIDIQLRRAARPALPVNMHAPVSDSMQEKKRKLDRRRLQDKNWEEL